MVHQPKKRRLTKNPQRPAAENGIDMFSKLPFELIAEILSLTSSKEVLVSGPHSKLRL